MNINDIAAILMIALVSITCLIKLLPKKAKKIEKKPVFLSDIYGYVR